MASTGTATNGFGKEPMSVPDIVQEAGNFDYNPDIPLKSWLRAADAIQKQAQSYRRDGDDQDEYLFLMRHALLITEKLTKHPDARTAQNLSAIKKANSDVFRNLRRMEELKPRIKKRSEEWQAAAAKRRADREAWAKHAGSAGHSRGPSSGHIADQMRGLTVRDRDRRGSGGIEGSSYREKLELDPASSRDLAARLARKEMRRTRRNSKGDAPTDERDDDLARRIIATGRRGQEMLSERSDSRKAGEHGYRQSTTAAYPSVPRKHGYDRSQDSWLDLDLSSSDPHRTYSPDRPPKIASGQNGLPQRPPKLEPHLPPLPQKIAYASDDSSPVSRASTSTPELKTSDYSIKSTASTEGGVPLRTVFLPPSLRTSFLNIASSNTARNLETCGILCGQLISNAFFISHLVIPEQESTSDTCDTLNEEAVFEYCDERELLTLGWIHTHPTQSCFMSSRDLHTHGGYQVQMAEALAIVCAPRHEPSWGVFRLTDPPGLKTILSCRQTGLFHPHGEVNVYTDALKPGHVWELPGLEFEVADLRPKS